MKKGNYGLDAPKVVITYLILGIVLFILGIILAPKFYYGGWVINLGIILFIVGLYFIYGSKVGKYKLRERIIQKLSVKGNENVLDVGCGRGLMLNGIASKLSSGKAYGIDIWSARDQSGNNSDAVHQNAKIEGVDNNIEVINSDMRKMPFEEKYMDKIRKLKITKNLKVYEKADYINNSQGVYHECNMRNIL